MTKPTMNRVALNDASQVEDGEPVLRVPRRWLVLGLVLPGLLVFGSFLAWIAYHSADRNDRLSELASDPAMIPPPVTFIPPTLDPGVDMGAGMSRYTVSPDDDPALGPVDAPELMIEFSDYQCQYCGKFARETLHPLLELYEDQIRFVYRDFVIYGPLSFQAALSAECANEQGAFWLYHDRLFEQQDNLTPEFFFAMAEELNLDLQQFARCVSDPVVEAEVKADTAAGYDLSIRGTPTFYINGRVLVGAQPLETFAAIIDEELARSADSSPQDAPDDA